VPGENFSRRVARAASVGGGRTYRRQTPIGWYALLMLICVLGVGLIAYSRYEASQPKAAATKTNTTPPTSQNLWTVGFALDVCGKVKNLPASTTSGPFTTNGQGLVAIEPKLASLPATASGKNAVLNALLVGAGISLTNTNLTVAPPPSATTTTTTTSPSTTTSTTTASNSSSTSTSSPSSSTSSTSTTTASSSTSSTSSSTTTSSLPAAKTYTNGQSCEGGKGRVEAEVWKSPSAKKGKIYTKNAASIRFKDGQLITLAFLPKGASIPKPASAKQVSDALISNPGGLAPASAGSTGTATTPSLPATTVPTTTTAAPATTSSGKGSTSTTGG
jgi:hypothetical protein